jgi:hypothetical protein
VTQKRERAKKEQGRKERVIHTRVSATLEEELKRVAGTLRVPVSNLVRSLLEDAIASRAPKLEYTIPKTQPPSLTKGPPAKLSKRELEALDGVVGFQPVKLNVRGACAVCARALVQGEEAFFGLTNDPGRRVVVCTRCLP